MTRRILKLLLILALLTATWLFYPALAQEGTIPTPPAELTTADVEAGMAIYQERCMSCHGATGMGDGELAAQSIQPPMPIGSVEYLAAADIALMRETVLNGRIERGMPPFGPGTTDPLSDEDVTNVLAAVYSLAPLNAPLPSAIVSGRVVNGTTGEDVTGNVTISLDGFTREFQPAISISTTLDAEGNFLFNLENVSPSWAFIASADYEGVDFTGDVFQLEALTPEQETIITVFDPTTEASDITLQQWHIVVDVVDGALQICEVFIFVNGGTTVYVGATGNPDEGTIRVPIPPESGEPSFRRGFGGADSFLPAQEFFQDGSDWVDVLPMRPDPGGMIILAQYSLPYEGEITLERPIYYPAEAISIVVPQGVEVDTDDGWEEGEAQNLTGQGNFVTYRLAAASTSDSYTLRLSGEPDLTASAAAGGSVVVRNENNELFIGVVALALVLGGAFYFYRSQRAAAAPQDEDEPEFDKESLLQAIADLDDQFAAGEIEESAYKAERQRLKTMLMDVW